MNKVVSNDRNTTTLDKIKNLRVEVRSGPLARPNRTLNQTSFKEGTVVASIRPIQIGRRPHRLPRPLMPAATAP